MAGWLVEFLSGMMDAMRGLFGGRGDSYVPQRPRKPEGSKTRQALETLKQAARSDPEAARFYLQQRILVGDGVGAAEFYKETILPRYPELTLSPVEQQAMVRLFVFGGHREPALAASELFLRRYGADSGWEAVALAFGRLLLDGTTPDRTREAVYHLLRVEQRALQKRDQNEAKQLREALLMRAEMEGWDIVLPGDLPLAPVETAPERGRKEPEIDTGLQMRVASGPKRRSVGPKDRGEGNGAGSDGAGSSSQVLEGRSPLPLKSAPGAHVNLNKKEGEEDGAGPEGADSAGLELPKLELNKLPGRIAGLMPLDKARRSLDTDAGDSAYGVAPDPENSPHPSLQKEEGRGQGENAYGAAPSEGQKAGRSGAGAAETSMPESRAKLPSMRKEVTSASGHISAGGDMFEKATLAGSDMGEERKLKSERAGTAKRTGDTAEQSAPAGPKFALILEDPSAAPAEVVESLAIAHAGGGDAGRTVRGIAGLVLREATKQLAEQVKGALAEHQIAGRVVAEDHPALAPSATEALSLQIEGEAVSFATGNGKVRMAAADVLLLYMARMRLSRSSRSSQAVLEVVGRSEGKPVRLTLWERTWSRAACRVEGEAIPAEATLTDLGLALADRLPRTALAESVGRLADSQGALPVAGSFGEHEDAVVYEVLRRGEG